jgi:four helix bundle protein
MEELGFTKLQIWQKAHELTLKVYQCTSDFPVIEKYGLVSQLRRASVSVVSNIAESQGRYYYAEIIRFLYDAKGSILEIQAQLFIVRDLKYLKKAEAEKLIEEYTNLMKQLNSFINYKRKKKEHS